MIPSLIIYASVHIPDLNSIIQKKKPQKITIFKPLKIQNHDISSSNHANWFLKLP